LADSPIYLCSFDILTEYSVKNFADEAFDKVSAHCKVRSGVVSYILENNFVHFREGSAKSCSSVHIHTMKTF